VQSEIELRSARVALAAGAATQLVVDAAAFVTLGGNDEKATGFERLFLVLCDLDFDLRLLRLDLCFGWLVPRLLLLGDPVLELVFDVAAQLDVGAAAGHVGGNGY